MLKKNSIDIEIEHIDSWFAICGYILPRTEHELLVFNKFYEDFEFKLDGKELDPDKIWNGIKQTDVTNSNVVKVDFSGFKMAARGLNSLPENILEKMRNNQMINKDAE